MPRSLRLHELLSPHLAPGSASMSRSWPSLGRPTPSGCSSPLHPRRSDVDSSDLPPLCSSAAESVLSSSGAEKLGSLEPGPLAPPFRRGCRQLSPRAVCYPALQLGAPSLTEKSSQSNAIATVADPSSGAHQLLRDLVAHGVGSIGIRVHGIKPRPPGDRKSHREVELLARRVHSPPAPLRAKSSKSRNAFTAPSRPETPPSPRCSERTAHRPPTPDGSTFSLRSP